jgi:hypothetical protein
MPVQKQGGCKKKLRQWSLQQKVNAEARAIWRKDANVIRSSQGVLQSRADAITIAKMPALQRLAELCERRALLNKKPKPGA